MVKVDLTKKPYFLEKEDIQWVEDTIAEMTTEEKIGQLFVNMGSERSEGYLKDVLEKYHIGAVRYNPGTSKEVHEQNRILQENSKIPLIIACNTENGGNGACNPGITAGWFNQFNAWFQHAALFGIPNHVGTDTALNAEAGVTRFHLRQNASVTDAIQANQRRVTDSQRVIFKNLTHGLSLTV